MTLVYLSIVWLAGIAAARWLRPPLTLVGLLAVLPLAGFLLWRNDPRIRRISACGLFLLLGSLRYTLSLPHLADPGHIAAYVDQGRVTIRGVVADEPDVRDTYTNLRLAADWVEIKGEGHPVRGAILVRAPCYPSYSYGDELQVEGLLETPPVFERFSYRDYLARQGIYGLVCRPEITLLSRGGGNPLHRLLLAFKARVQGVIARILPEPEASLLTGILLGVEAGIPKRVMEAFSATNTTHIIAISGFNISVLAGMLSMAARRLAGRRRMALLTIAGIAAYTILVGASASVVRAAIMGSLYLLARHFGREGDVLTGCLLAAFLMTLHNPLVLWDVGFQLSFAATLGLILYARPFEERAQALLGRVLPPGWADRALSLLSDALLVTLAAQLTTFPLLLHYFGRLSVVSLLANGLILPVQPAIMFCGGLAAGLGLVWLPLGRVLGWLAWLPLTYTIRVVEWAASFPWASVPVEGFSSWAVAAWYGALAFLTWGLRWGSEGWRTLRDRLRARISTALSLGLLLAAALLIWAAVLSLPDGRLHVVFFDVGEGDSIFIQTPHGHQILVDGGPSPSLLLGGLGRAMPFWDRSLDLVVLTHPDEDHLAGLVPVLKRYRVGHAMEPALPHETPLAEEWGRLLSERGVHQVIGQRGMRIAVEDGVLLEVLHPGPILLQGTEADDNNNSLVLRLVYGRSSFFLAGDLEHEGEEVLLKAGQPVRSWVLKVAHHGAKSGTGEPFLAAVAPRLAVISVGRGNRFGHPSPELLRRLAEQGVSVLRTDERGQIEIITDGERCWVRTEH